MPDRSRLNRIASNMSGDDQPKQFASREELRREVEERFGTGIVNQEALERLAEQVWLNTPANLKGRFTAEDWKAKIYEKCAVALERAEQALRDRNEDDRIYHSKLNILRADFANQVRRAMKDVADRINSEIERQKRR